MKKYISKSILILAIITLSLTTNSILAQTKKDNKKATAEKYKSVKIGNQIWMTENLNVSTFRNGDPIIEDSKVEKVRGIEDAGDFGRGKFYPSVYCDNELKNSKLYNWFAVNDSRGLAPKGWHIPSREEWETLINFLGGKEEVLKKLKSTSGWGGDDSDGTNESGFNAIYSRGKERNEYEAFDSYSYAYFWTSSQYSVVGYNSAFKAYAINFNGSYSVVGIYGRYKNSLFNVRCVKDDNILDEDTNPKKTSTKTSVSSKTPSVKSKKTTSQKDMSGFHLTGHKNTGMDAYTDAERAEIKKKQQDKERHQVELNKKAQQKFDAERARKTNVPQVKARVRGANEPANTIAK